MKVLIDQLSKCEDIDEITQFFVYQSVQSTITLINHYNFELQSDGLKYLEWLFINTQQFLKVNINQVQAETTSTFRNLAKNQPLLKDKLLSLLDILKKLSNQIIEFNDNSIKNLREDIVELLFQQGKNADIIQNLQHLKLKVCVNIVLKLLQINNYCFS